MSNEEIKKEVHGQYAIIKNAKTRLDELRAICKHEKHYEGLYGETLRDAYPSIICSYCGQWVGVCHKPFSDFEIKL